MQSFIYLLTKPNGYVLHSGTNPNTTPGKGIFFRAETEISAWTDDNGVDLVALFGLSGTLGVTDPPLMVPGFKKSGSITLASGSIGIIL